MHVSLNGSNMALGTVHNVVILDNSVSERVLVDDLVFMCVLIARFG